MTTTTETPNTDTDTPAVEPVDLDKFAKGGTDQYISTIWPKLKSAIKALNGKSADLEKYTPPKEMEIYEFVKNPEKGQKDETIRKASESIAKLEKALAEQRSIAHTRAKELLQPESVTPEKLAELTKEFETERDAAAGQLEAIKVFANTMTNVNPDIYAPVLAAFDKLNLPRKPYRLNVAAGGSSSTYTPDPLVKEFKEWADANGVSYPSRGRIPQDKMDAFKKATGKA